MRTENPYKKIRKKIVEHVKREVLGSELQKIDKDAAKKIFDYLEKTPSHEIARKIAEDELEYARIKNIVKHTYRYALRYPSATDLAKLVLLWKFGEMENQNAIHQHAANILTKKGVVIRGDSKSNSIISFLKNLNAIEHRKGKIVLKNPVIVEALIEWFSERGNLRTERINERILQKLRDNKVSVVQRYINKAMRQAGIRELKTAEDLERLLNELKKIGQNLKQKGKRSEYYMIERLLMPSNRQIATLAAILKRDEIRQEHITEEAKRLGLRETGAVYLSPYEIMGLIQYMREPRNKKILVIKRKKKLLEILVDKYLNDKKTRKALELLDNIPPNYSISGVDTKEQILRAKIAADLIFGKDNPLGFLYVLLNPHDIRTKGNTQNIRTTRNYIKRRFFSLLSDPKFLMGLEEGQKIKRIPESLKYMLWIGRVAKIVPVDAKTQKVVWVSKDTARAWAEFFERHRKRVFKERRKKSG